MNRLLPTFAALILLALPAEAHRLKLFAHVSGETIAGYGFYIGGGRPQGAEIIVSGADGHEVSRLTTAADGSFAYTPAHPGSYHLSLSGGDGHIATADISTDGAPALKSASTAAPGTGPTALPADLDARIAAAVDAAVARQITPLLEAYAAADGKVRFNDLLGGIGWIVGMAGLWAWFRSRRTTPDDRHGD